MTITIVSQLSVSTYIYYGIIVDYTHNSGKDHRTTNPVVDALSYIYVFFINDASTEYIARLCMYISCTDILRVF